MILVCDNKIWNIVEFFSLPFFALTIQDQIYYYTRDSLITCHCIMNVELFWICITKIKTDKETLKATNNNNKKKRSRIVLSWMKPKQKQKKKKSNSLTSANLYMKQTIYLFCGKYWNKKIISLGIQQITGSIQLGLIESTKFFFDYLHHELRI